MVEEEIGNPEILKNGQVKKEVLAIEEDTDKKKSKEKEPKEPKKSVSYLSLFRYSSPLDQLFIFLGLVFAILCGFTLPIVMYLFGDIIGVIVTYAETMGNTTFTENMSQDNITLITDQFRSDSLLRCVELIVVGALSVIFTYISNTLIHYSASRQILKIRTKFFQNMLNQDIGWYDVHQTGDFASSLTENIAKMEEGMGEKLSIFIFYKTVFASGVIFALVLGWELALISLISLPVSTIIMGLVAWLTSKFAKKEMEAYASASYVAEEVFSALRTVVAFAGEDKEKERYEKHLILARNNNIRRAFFNAISNGLLWFFVFSCYALSFWYGIGLIIEERNLPPEERVYTPAKVVSVFTICIMSCWYFGVGAPFVETFSVATGAAEKIFNILDSKPIINDSKENGYMMKNVDGTITFRNVRFHYPSRKDVEVLKGLNLNIAAGETVALVGSSGCGKSTIIQLIQRFYDPTFGEVCLDGNDLKHFNLSWLREHIGVVGQEPVLFATTIAENIRYGNKQATMLDIERAARKANAHDFILCLPKGYNTIIGERGAQLSGGQKQRIAIARALIRNPKILLLDEATSALDMHSEAKVQETLDSASTECTTVIVAHRLSTVRNAQRIVVLSDGQVVEEGTHDELIAKQGAYYKLTLSQETKSDDLMLNEEELEEINKTVKLEAVKERKKSSAFAEFVHTEVEPEQVKNIGAFEVLAKVLELNRTEWLFIILGCVFAIINGSVMPIYSVVFGDIIGVLSETDNHLLRTQTNMFCLYFLLIGIVAAGATFLQTYLFSISGEKLTKRIRSLMFQSLMKQEMAWFDRRENGVGAICTKLSAQASAVQGASGASIGTVLNALGTYLLSAVLALYFEWRLALVALAFSPFIFISIYLEQKYTNDSGPGKQKTLEMSGKVAIEAISNIRTLASLGCEDEFYKLYVNNLVPYHRSSEKSSHFRALVLGFARGLMSFSYAFSIYYGVHLIITTGLEYGIVFKVCETVIVGSWAIGNAFAYTPNFQKGFSAASEIFQLLDRIPKIRNHPGAVPYLWSKARMDFSTICFSYPTRPTVRVLKGLNMSVLEGKTVALVGPSGCGKSTIIQLLERFYDPTAGIISGDGEYIQKIHLKALRSQLGIVSQEPNLFDRSIAENIAYGANNRIVPMEEIIEVAKMANIHDFVSSLPLGYETKLGEKGTQLSGGQKQRIAIARALVRNPKVLLLDEATSALDNESEKIVQAALDNAQKGRTCITIAHRLTTIQDADVICVIADGRVAEQGTHSELIAQRGIYYNLYSLQANRL